MRRSRRRSLSGRRWCNCPLREGEQRVHSPFFKFDLPKKEGKGEQRVHSPFLCLVVLLLLLFVTPQGGRAQRERRGRMPGRDGPRTHQPNHPTPIDWQLRPLTSDVAEIMRRSRRRSLSGRRWCNCPLREGEQRVHSPFFKFDLPKKEGKGEQRVHSPFLCLVVLLLLLFVTPQGGRAQRERRGRMPGRDGPRTHQPNHPTPIDWQSRPLTSEVARGRDGPRKKCLWART